MYQAHTAAHPAHRSGKLDGGAAQLIDSRHQTSRRLLGSGYDLFQLFEDSLAAALPSSQAGFGFDRPGIRGLAKMRVRVTMPMTIMLAMALERIRAGQPEHLRSLVQPA